MNLFKKEDTETASVIRQNLAVTKNVVTREESSILVIDDNGRRWRLPRGAEAYTELTESDELRICREVATERDLLNLHGTFYELPAENADGFAKVRPIASHGLAVYDYASYRGLLVMTGIEGTHRANEHIISSADGKAHVWVGSIEYLW